MPLPPAVAALPPITPVQVWAGLSPDLQDRAVRLLARLACAQYTTRDTTGPAMLTMKEATNALVSCHRPCPCHRQDPSHAS